MQSSGRQRLRWGIIALLLTLTVSNLAVWASSETQSKAPLFVRDATKTDAFASYTRVILFESSTEQWVLSAFAQAKPGDEFTFNNRLYCAVDSAKAQIVPNIDVGKLVEADIPYDKTSRRPAASDAVQVLDKDMQFVAHASLATVQPGATIRFQGRAYTVKSDRSLADTGTIFSAATSALQRIEITRSALQHIFDRHTVGGAKNAGKSTFDTGEDIQSLIRNAQLLTPVLQSGGNSQRVFDAGRIIGTDRATGKQTSIYTVITTQSGKLVTAFPGMP